MKSYPRNSLLWSLPIWDEMFEQAFFVILMPACMAVAGKWQSPSSLMFEHCKQWNSHAMGAMHISRLVAAK